MDWGLRRYRHFPPSLFLWYNHTFEIYVFSAHLAKLDSAVAVRVFENHRRRDRVDRGESSQVALLRRLVVSQARTITFEFVGLFPPRSLLPSLSRAMSMVE